jgi:hypothetical protein
MADEGQISSMPPQPQTTPESFLQESIAPRFKQRVDDLRRRILTLEQEVQDHLGAQTTIRVVIEGEGGGTWYLNIKAGEMTVGTEPAFAPLMTTYQFYTDWQVTVTGNEAMLAPGQGGGQRELTKSRIERLKMLKGMIRFTFTHFPDGSERGFDLQFGEGERPAAPQTVMSLKIEDAQKMARGELNPQVAFMNGTIKVSGDMALAMQFGAAMM